MLIVVRDSIAVSMVIEEISRGNLQLIKTACPDLKPQICTCPLPAGLARTTEMARA